MQNTWQQSQWINNNTLKRQFIAFVISLLIVVLILLIPIHLSFDTEYQQSTIEIELSKDKPQPIIDLKPESPAVKKSETADTQPIPEPIIQKSVEKPQKIADEKSKDLPPSIVSPIIEVTRTPKTTVAEQPNKLPSSGVIFDSAYGKVHLYELDDDFKARTGNEDDFIFKEIKQPEWNMVTKLIDEEVDKPRVYMNFYSEGIVGSTERFFDKISYKKVFTTRYGTKIACGGVGPLIMCSWK